jgi:predicted ArsR family transcriptional regulator
MDSTGVESDLKSIAALGDPARLALYKYVVGQAGPVSRDQAAEGVGVARHVAKFNLDKLEQEGLLAVEFHRPTGRRGPGAGRPAKFYRRSEREIAVSLPERHYDVAGQLMAQAISDAQTAGTPVASALRKAARAFGAGLADQVKQRTGPRAGRTKLTRSLLDVLTESGYEPTGDARGVTLANCPFHRLAEEHTSLVCGMNKDLIEGLLGGIPTSFRAALDPSPGRCCVRLHPVNAT